MGLYINHFSNFSGFSREIKSNSKKLNLNNNWFLFLFVFLEKKNLINKNNTNSNFFHQNKRNSKSKHVLND